MMVTEAFRQGQPHSPHHVGLSHLYIDLDQNGHAELVTSEVGECDGETLGFGV